jgi:hypothetical protein
MPLNEPKRRELRRTHLDASVVPVERALLARADELAFAGQTALDNEEGGAEVLLGTVRAAIGQEFRAMAEELHWW